MSEPEPFRGQRVNIGGADLFVPVATEVVGTERVDGYDDEVRNRGLLRGGGMGKSKQAGYRRGPAGERHGLGNYISALEWRWEVGRAVLV